MGSFTSVTLRISEEGLKNITREKVYPQSLECRSNLFTMKHIFTNKMQEIEKENLNFMEVPGERSSKGLAHRGRGYKFCNTHQIR